jgi:2-keto-4-pentenoate hydratase
MDERRVARTADLLRDAADSGGIVSLAAEDLPATQDEAEAIQDYNLRRSAEPVGAWKLGATTGASKAALGLKRPFAGAVAAGRVFRSGATIPAGMLRQRGVEVEIAFRLDRDLPADGEPWTAELIREAIGSVHAAFEIPNARMEKIGAYGAPALVADNGAASVAIIGDGIEAWSPDALSSLAVTLRLGDAPVVTGSSADVVPSVFGALVEVLAGLQRRGYDLYHGQFFLTGSCTPFAPAGIGVAAVGEIEAIGKVSARLE